MLINLNIDNQQFVPLFYVQGDYKNKLSLSGDSHRKNELRSHFIFELL